MGERATTTVHIVRHGESIANARAIPGAGNNDLRYVDAALTAQGEAQAARLADRILDLRPDLVISSPMTRALQTCTLACSRLPPARREILVTPLCTERVGYSCDVGSPVAVLQERFAYIDFSHIPADNWWWSGNEETPLPTEILVEGLKQGRHESMGHILNRCAEFKAFCAAREETNIVVFAHGVFLRRFQETITRQNERYFLNCEIRKVVLKE